MPDQTKNEEIALDAYDVVEAYTKAQTSAPHDLSLVRAWIARYPQFRPELSAASYAQMTEGPDWLASSLSDDEEPDAEIVEIGRRLLSAQSQAISTIPPLTSLAEAAKRQGLTPKALAEQIHTDMSLLAKLEQRGIRVATLPRLLVQSLADAIQRSVSDVAAYLSSPPRLPAAAHFKAQQAPTVGAQEDFNAALRSAAPDVQAYWQAHGSDGSLLGGLEDAE